MEWVNQKVEMKLLEIHPTKGT